MNKDVTPWKAYHFYLQQLIRNAFDEEEVTV